MLFNIPYSSGCIVTHTCYKIAMFEKYNLRDLFLMAFIAMHKFECAPIPDSDELLFFKGYYHQILLNCDDRLNSSTMWINFSYVIETNWLLF